MGLIMVVGIVAKTGSCLLDADQRFRAMGMNAEEAIVQGWEGDSAAYRDDRFGCIVGMLRLSLALGAGSQMRQRLAILVIGGTVISMVLALLITSHDSLPCNLSRKTKSSLMKSKLNILLAFSLSLTLTPALLAAGRPEVPGYRTTLL